MMNSGLLRIANCEAAASIAALLLLVIAQRYIAERPRARQNMGQIVKTWVNVLGLNDPYKNYMA
jgi:hypothetical protein